MNLAPPDYVILALALGGAVTGLFIGFSGALAFLAGTAAAFCAARFGWPAVAGFFPSALVRALVVALATLVVFWAVRMLVRRTIRLAVAQPGDALFGALAGFVSGLAAGAGLVWLAAFLGIPGADGSALLNQVVSHVG